MKVIVAPHDPAWACEFETEAQLIRDAVGDLVLRLHHIGSTAIPGISAKPIIDILMEVRDIDELDSRSSSMQCLGYEAKGEFGIPGRRYFRKDSASGERTHQVHAFAAHSPEIERHLAFRDYMITHPEAAQRYSELKQLLAREHSSDIQAYMDGKDAFIKEQEAKALAWRASRIPR
ncbi:MAG: GrpB family protein [Candidatus Omnitrophica bacterium]|nr:hypothetical protein [bacterium]NUN95526.1 GrpB family protein [Candidatus Omnitrophota bacterium]